ncbi:type II toxin-antitoxin system VapB family antitoxin [Thiolapillus sp.]
MKTAHTKIFKSNQSQAVRLPKNVALPDTIVEVDIVAIGNKRIITPAGGAWDDWFDGPTATSDFMSTRDQPEDQERQTL